MSGSGKNLYLNDNTLGVAVVLFGLLYIPAFIYGYFWLWVFPFTAIVTLFVRVMIDSAIDQVSKVGDEAKQAKEMIPEFIKMNIVMTVLLSIPFVSALYLHQFGYIVRAPLEGLDYAFMEWFLGLWAKKYMLQQMMLVAQEVAGVQIMLSNLCFVMIAIVGLLAACWRNITKLFVILFHKESYKFLQIPPTRGDVSSLTGIIIQAVIMIGIFGVETLIHTDVSIYELIIYIVFINLLVMVQSENIVSAFVEYRIRKNNKFVKEQVHD